MDLSVKTIITRDDVVRGGACSDGVDSWLKEHAPTATALLVSDALELCESDGEREHIARAAGLVGNGNGDGNGYGNGYGNGDGYGYGNGYGNGNGDGYGYGNGNGNGDGDGYGYGYGNGNGDGYGGQQ